MTRENLRNVVENSRFIKFQRQKRIAIVEFFNVAFCVENLKNCVQNCVIFLNYLNLIKSLSENVREIKIITQKSERIIFRDKCY